MSAIVGSRFGAFEILALLGRGGMGEVYRARDLELGRAVAIKLLRPEIASDVHLLQRFRREAKVLASLNHPHIAQIYGIVEGTAPEAAADPPRGLVLELVEGETLDDRLRKGGLETLEALRIARQIADALEAAHAQGIVHRDLKPANIKITPAGTVKVLDFGIATTAHQEGGERTTQLATATATVIGTPAYMSPEQARGQSVDKRTDVWAFGCVLYELLTGHRAFGGATTADILGGVLQREPDWSSLSADSPEDVRRLLQRCLRKEPSERLRDMGDIRVLIDDALAAAPVVNATPHDRRPRSGTISAAALLAAIVIVAGGVLYWRGGPSGTESIALSVSAPGEYLPNFSVAVSPNGRYLAFVSSDEQGKSRLWVRALSSTEPRALPGTEAAVHPFWSPDSRSLGFVADEKLKRVEIDGGTAQIITDAVRSGGSWGRGNMILYKASFTSKLRAIPASGGPSIEMASVGVGAKWPQFLPDGRRFLYFEDNAASEKRGIYMGSLDSPERTHLLVTDFRAFYALPGYLLFVRGESLMAQPVDIERGRLTGEPRRIADGVWVNQPAAQASFGVSETGMIAYVNATLWNTQLAWFDREGHLLSALGPPDRYLAAVPEISPDGKHVAVARGPWPGDDIWILGVNDRTSRRFSFSPEHEFDPTWSPDGKRVLFRTQGPGGGLVIANEDGTGEVQSLVQGPGPQNGHSLDWSLDGRFIVYCVPGENRLPDIWFVELNGDRKPKPFLQTRATEYTPQLSPDGRWLAYASNELGREEIYVQRFPEGGSMHQISVNGGTQPRWPGDGRELFYLGIDAQLMAVKISASGTFESSAPKALFQSRMTGTPSSTSGHTYDVTADGQRFLANINTSEAAITVITNWQTALGQ